MTYDFSKIKGRVGEIEDWFITELTHLRTGRATPALLDSVLVESYGAKQPLKNIAAIGTEDARTLRIQPWDKSTIGDIERAISASNLGVSPIADNDGIRISFPVLTDERRVILIKLLNEKMEEGKISIKKERDEVWEDIQNKEKSKEMTEDEKFRFKDDLQKIIDEANKKLEEITGKKENEIKG